MRCCGRAAVVLVVLAHVAAAIALLALSIGDVEYNQYALRADRLSGVLSAETLLSGRYIVGITGNLLYLPSLVKRLEFSEGERGWDASQAIARRIHARTNDGLGLTFYISFEYRLRPAAIPAMVRRFGTTYESQLVYIADESVRITAGNYSSVQFYEQRPQINDAMHALLSSRLDQVGVDVPVFMIGEIDLSSLQTSVLEDLAVQRQLVTIRQFQQQATTVRLATSVLVAQNDAAIKIIEAEAAAESLLLLTHARADGLRTLTDADSSSWQYFAQRVGLNTTELLAAQWLRVASERDSSRLVMRTPLPSAATLLS